MGYLRGLATKTRRERTSEAPVWIFQQAAKPPEERQGARDAVSAKFRCPICRKPVQQGGVSFPFCTERCRCVDLGQWFNESYTVSHPLTPLQRLEMEEDGEWDRLASEQDE